MSKLSEALISQLQGGGYVDPFRTEMAAGLRKPQPRGVGPMLSGTPIQSETIGDYLMRTALDPNIVERGSILPFGKTNHGQTVPALPNSLVGLLEAVMLPSHVQRGGAFTGDDVVNAGLGVGATGGALGGAMSPALLNMGGGRISGERIGQILKSKQINDGLQGRRKQKTFRKWLDEFLPRSNLLNKDERGLAQLYSKELAPALSKRKNRMNAKNLRDPLAEPTINKFMADKKAREATKAKAALENARRQRDIEFAEALKGKADSYVQSGLWGRKFAEEVKRYSHPDWIYLANDAVNRANMEAVPRALKKKGWKVRHASSGRDGRRSSRYLQSPDGKFEVRLSDHELPYNPRREYNQSQFGTRWDEEVILNGRETPEGIIDEIIRLYRGE